MVVTLIEQAEEVAADTVIPASALAQAWRGGPRMARLAKLLEGVEVDTLDQARAKQVGLRLATHDRADVVDAHVAACGAERTAAIATSDPHDIEALLDPTDQAQTIAV